MRSAQTLLPGAGFQVDALLAPRQALTLFFAHARLNAPQTESVEIEDAFGRVLAQRAQADADYPAAARSTMDGFAVRSADTPGRLKIAGEIRMGHPWEAQLRSGTALRIPTGGVLPPGADAVVPVEDAPEAGGEIAVASAVPPGDAVNPAGSDMLPGETLLEPGRRLGGAELGVLATLGVVSVRVYRRPRVAVISSGDELVDARSVPGIAQVRDSNRWAVAGTLAALGASVLHLPIAPDDPSRLEAILREGLSRADAVVLSGGSSVGERDWTPRIIGRLGEPGVIVHGLRVKPGKPTVLACTDGKPIVGLPGNPASAMLILEAVAAPIVAALTGAAVRTRAVPAVLGSAVSKRLGWTWYVPAVLDETQRPAVAESLQIRSSSVSLLARASGYMVLDEAVESLEAGSPVTVTRFLQGGV